MKRIGLSCCRGFLALVAMGWASSASAQNAPAPGGGDTSGGDTQAPSGPSVTVVQLPPSQAPAPQVYTPYGPLPPQGYDPNGHLNSSSRATDDINGRGDGFDLLPGQDKTASMRGSATGSYVVEGQFVPEAHSVRRGDTLWEISSKYYQNPYKWPQIWSYNPQIQNPHWIYPGDRIRLREVGDNGNGIGFTRHRAVPEDTVFLRDVGWVDDKKEDTWGELVASPSDQMFLSGDGVEVYIQLEEGHDVTIGEELTIFRPLRTVESDDAKGELVSIRGTVRVDRYNPKTHTVRAEVIESLDVIERGARVGPVGRRFDVVPPIVSDQDVEVGILATLYPYEIIGQHQVVFLDKGEKEGLKAGTRLFGVRRGDRWMRDLKYAGQLAKQRPRVEDERPSRVEGMRTSVDDDILPDETFAEVRVLRVRDHSATGLVVRSIHELDKSARLFGRKGY